MDITEIKRITVQTTPVIALIPRQENHSHHSIKRITVQTMTPFAVRVTIPERHHSHREGAAPCQPEPGRSTSPT